MDEKTNIKNELKEQAPFLSEELRKSEGGFRVPENYFESLSDKIIAKVNQADIDSETPPISLHTEAPVVAIQKRRSFRLMGIAASIALIIIAGLWLFPQQGSSSSENQFVTLEKYNEAEILAYLDENIDDFSFEHLLESGILSEADIDFKDIYDISEEETDLYLETLLDMDSEDI